MGYHSLGVWVCVWCALRQTYCQQSKVNNLPVLASNNKKAGGTISKLLFWAASYETSGNHDQRIAQSRRSRDRAVTELGRAEPSDVSCLGWLVRAAGYLPVSITIRRDAVSGHAGTRYMCISGG
jgi:hypothetical protein